MYAPWQPLLDWWFGTAELSPEVAKARSKLWFGKKKSQDNDACERFGAQVEQALVGGLSEWAENPQGWLALVLLLDQLPRMIYRGTPKSFSGDHRAQELVVHGLKLSRDQHLLPVQRLFIYLVLEHAEDLALQDQAVACLTELHNLQPATDRDVFAENLDYAKKHQRVIARFSRFPHRNQALGRTSTEEELAFLKEPGSRF